MVSSAFSARRRVMLAAVSTATMPVKERPALVLTR
jgi:hypothetical protein